MIYNVLILEWRFTCFDEFQFADFVKEYYQEYMTGYYIPSSWMFGHVLSMYTNPSDLKFTIL